MPIPKDIQLQRYNDGTPSILRQKIVYTELFFYRKSDVLTQLTKVFCKRFLPTYHDRTVDQMVQAARSVKQNIVEGLTDGQTSFEVEIKLLGIAKGSNQELCEDFQDYLKQHHLCNWANERNTPNDAPWKKDIANRYDKLLAYCRTHNNLEDYEPFFQKWTDEEMCNIAITLCHMVDKMLSSFIAKRDHEFVEEGGIRERMTAARLDRRGTQKEIIEKLERENAQLKARIALLERELAALKAGESAPPP